MDNRTIKVLTSEEIEKRYPKTDKSFCANLSRDYEKRGCSIVCFKKDVFSYQGPEEVEFDLLALVKNILANAEVEFVGYTDLSELDKDTIYVACRKIDSNILYKK